MSVDKVLKQEQTLPSLLSSVEQEAKGLQSPPCLGSIHFCTMCLVCVRAITASHLTNMERDYITMVTQNNPPVPVPCGCHADTHPPLMGCCMSGSPRGSPLRDRTRRSD